MYFPEPTDGHLVASSSAVAENAALEESYSCALSRRPGTGCLAGSQHSLVSIVDVKFWLTFSLLGAAGSWPGRLFPLLCGPLPPCWPRSEQLSLQGCEERLTRFTLFPRPWSAVRVKEYGYTRLHILNGTHVHVQQVSDDQVSEGCPSHHPEQLAQHARSWELTSQESWVQILPLLLPASWPPGT